MTEKQSKRSEKSCRQKKTEKLCILILNTFYKVYKRRKKIQVILKEAAWKTTN